MPVKEFVAVKELERVCAYPIRLKKENDSPFQCNQSARFCSLEKERLLYYNIDTIVKRIQVISDCPAGKKTDNAEGRCCVFPFVYGGVSYDSCTKVNHNRLWCSFTAVYSGQWANCVDPCTNNPCQNAGTCTVTGDDTYSCQCPDGFEGNNCETRIPCPPGKKTDNAEGRCCVFPFVYGGVSYDSCTKVNHNRLWCSFTAVYSGQWANCVDECASSPCKNGASCKTTENGYSCQPCPAGWKGINCDEDINECEASPCKNGATCENQPGGYSCSCMSGYTGQNCEQARHFSTTDINECASSPCANGATCHDEVGRYTCECPAGYKGTNCETDIDECEVDPCLNGGTCVNSPPGSYTCNCAEGYKGDHCQEVLMESIVETFIFVLMYAFPQGVNKCVTSSDGKLTDFKKYGGSSRCKTYDQGLGVGMRRANFVYTR
ncbi:hypothetical protein ACROYT_G025615 [Oculina patagonica]